MQEIWFRLVKENGDVILNDRVIRPNLKTVVDLRDELKENKCKNALKNFDAGQLKVYEQGATNALDEEEYIRNRGNSKANALVVVVPASQQEDARAAAEKEGSVHELLREMIVIQRQQQRAQEEMKEALVSLPHKESSKSYTEGALGQTELMRLRKDGLMIDAAPIEYEDAFWSEETQHQANAITDEAVFDAFITPFFNDVLASCGMVFVNSEKYQWLSQSPLVSRRTDLKPDGFATHRGMFREKQEPDDRVHRPNGFRFGVAEQELFDCLVLFESKLTISDAAFGQVVRYLQNLCPDASASAILFDRRSFWLIKSHKSVVVKVVTATWANNGSKPLFQNFITANKSPWITRLADACNSLNVDVVEGDAFLGRGAYGRVFKVMRDEEEVLALKIVEKGSTGRLYDEEEALKQAHHTGLTISLIGKTIELPNGAALLLSPVGKPLPRPTTMCEVANLFGLLWQLHVKDLVHGDPRVPNVILNGEEPLWIDLVEVRKATCALRSLDAEILTRSILNVPRKVSLDGSLKELIGEYSTSATHKNLSHLTTKVCQLLGFLTSN
jgi:tRNA A-37 threonylcarbamoyl transferase component Bud32